jgi:hypothetical protein
LWPHQPLRLHRPLSPSPRPARAKPVREADARAVTAARAVTVDAVNVANVGNVQNVETRENAESVLVAAPIAAIAHWQKARPARNVVAAVAVAPAKSNAQMLHRLKGVTHGKAVEMEAVVVVVNAALAKLALRR